MKEALQEICFHHHRREAVARCPECRRFFCRECITEHEERVICASCLQAATVATEQRRIPWAALAAPLQLTAGLLLAWLLFYGLGQILTAIPADFHAGSWKTLTEEFLE
jgi:hypothetical protein